MWGIIGVVTHPLDHTHDPGLSGRDGGASGETPNRPRAESDPGDSGVAEPTVAEAAMTRPDLAEPDLAEPDLAQPDLTGPEVAGPAVTEPEVAQPEVAGPELAEPDVAEPGVAEPDVAEPGVAEPDVAEPDVAEPGVAEPDVAEPGVAEPEQYRGPVELSDLVLRVARRSLAEEVGSDDRIGSYLGAIADDAVAVTASFAATERGYQDWRWSVTLAAGRPGSTDRQ